MATTLGNGVVDYNTADLAAKKKIIANQAKIKADQSYVQSEQQRAIQVIADRQKQGLDVTGQQKYLTQNLGYKEPATPTASAGASASGNANTSTSAEPKKDYKAEMAAIANRSIDPFNYDPNTDPSYQAALTRAKANIEAGNAQNQAEMNRRGILNSTITSDRGSEIAAQEMGNVETTVLPQLMQQAYQKYIDKLNQEQQQFNNLGTVDTAYANADQTAFANNITTAGLTGNLPGGEQAQGLVNQLLQLKQQAEAPNITAAERNKLSNQANGIRAMLSQLGVNASQYGAGVNYNTASQITPTIRTLAGQTQDNANATSALNNETNAYQLAQAKDPNSVANQVDKLNLEMKKIDASNYSTQQKLQLEQLQKTIDEIGKTPYQSEADTRLDQLKVQTAEAELEKLQQTAAPQTGKTYEDYQSNINKIAQRDKNNNLTNPDAVEEYIVTSDMSDYEQYRAYKAAGLKWPAGVPVPTKGE